MNKLFSLLVFSSLILGCGGDVEPVTKDEGAPPSPDEVKKMEEEEKRKDLTLPKTDDIPKE